MFSLFLSLRNQAPWYRKELVGCRVSMLPPFSMGMLSKILGKATLIAISCVGWVTNHFVGTKFPNQSDISAAVGWVSIDSSLLWL